MRICKLVKIVYLKFLEIYNPIKAADKYGVNHGQNFHLYGHIKWGSEPWIITIGDNVHLTDGVRFVTHDLPDNSVAVGVPARVIKTLDEHKEKLKAESLHFGHLKGKEKDEALKKYYGYNK